VWVLIVGVTLLGAIGGAAAAVLLARTPTARAAPSSYKIVAGARSPSPSLPPSPSLSASPSLPPAPTPTPAQEVAARELSALLADSASDRNVVVNAVSDVRQCGPDLAQDPQIFSSAIASRQRLLTQLAALPNASTLPSGLIQTLTGAWQASAEADQDYAAWAQDENSGKCVAYGSDPNLAAAAAPDNQATADKRAFVSRWNPIAMQYGLPTYQWSQL
jgi:hypothetical protein